MQEILYAAAFYGFWTAIILLTLALALGIPTVLAKGLIQLMRNRDPATPHEQSPTSQSEQDDQQRTRD